MRPSFGLGLALYGASAIAQVETPARYGVGFRVVHELDRSRTVGPARDFEGRARSGSTAVPIEIGVWYPTSVDASARRMTLGDYLVLSKLRDGDRPATADHALASREDQHEAGGLGQPAPPRSLSSISLLASWSDMWT